MNGSSAGLSSGQYNAVKGHAFTRLTNRPSSSSVSPRPHPPTFYRQVHPFNDSCVPNTVNADDETFTSIFIFFQPSFTFSYYGRVGSQRYRLRRTAPSRPQPITTSRSLNDLSDLHQRLDRRELQLSASTLSSDGSSSEGGPERGATVRLLWLSMMRVK